MPDPKAVSEETNWKGSIGMPRGKDKSIQTMVRSILMNEKYKGDSLLQKTCPPDFLTRKQVTNHGEILQYYTGCLFRHRKIGG